MLDFGQGIISHAKKWMMRLKQIMPVLLNPIRICFNNGASEAFQQSTTQKDLQMVYPPYPSNQIIKNVWEIIA